MSSDFSQLLLLTSLLVAVILIIVRNVAEFKGIKEASRRVREAEQEAFQENSKLFNLYSKQIEHYQQQIQARATWSFTFALLAMFAGLLFVVWGSAVLLTAETAIVIASGGLAAAFGAGISAFIAKTFLDVHKISLHQMTQYFQQPVINNHILMAQRLADEVGDAESKKRAYEMIIANMTELITANEKGS